MLKFGLAAVLLVGLAAPALAEELTATSSIGKYNKAMKKLEDIGRAVEAERWQYIAQTTPLGMVVRIACIDSDNEAALSWPYSGTFLRLCLRRRDGQLSFVVITLRDSQMLCSPAPEGCRVPVRYDEAPVSFVKLFEPTDKGSSAMVSDDLPAELLRAKTFVIGPTFYRDGRREIVFDLRGLDLRKL